MIHIENLRVTYDRPVLDGVSLHVPANTIFALIGPAAAGKSVLLKSIGGLLSNVTGSVIVNQRSVLTATTIQLAEIRREIGMLFQNYALFDHMTVAENIGFPLRRLFQLDEAEIRERVSERLRRVSLPGFEERFTVGLSGGQKKRVGVARATVAKPPIVLYDEPTAGLDPVTSQKIYDLIREEQRAQKSTVIAISSDVKGLLGIADHVAMLHRGELLAIGTKEEVFRSQDARVLQFLEGRAEGPL